MISAASISVQLPFHNLEPDELPNKIMEDFQKLDEHNESNQWDWGLDFAGNLLLREISFYITLQIYIFSRD